MSSLSERELVLQLKMGDINAFKSIYGIYNARIYNFSLKILPFPEEAKEVVQLVFIALWEQRLQVDEEKDLAAYLYSIARYQVYQVLRKQVYRNAAFEYIVNREQVLLKCIIKAKIHKGANPLFLNPITNW